MELADQLDLSSYLLKPVQRMTKYALLLQQMLKECRHTDPEYADLSVRYLIQTQNSKLTNTIQLIQIVQVSTPDQRFSERIANAWNCVTFLPRDAPVHSAVLHVVRLSVRLSVCDVGGSGSHRLEILETNCTDT